MWEINIKYFGPMWEINDETWTNVGNKHQIFWTNVGNKRKNNSNIMKTKEERLEIKRIKQREYVKNNKIKRRETLKNYRKRNTSTINKKRVNRYNEDDVFKLKRNITRNLTNKFNYTKHKKESMLVDILGCSIEHFKQHIIEQFEPWMSLENRGLYHPDKINYGWDISHINPLSEADTIEKVIEYNHYTNLKPVCSNKNRNKK